MKKAEKGEAVRGEGRAGCEGIDRREFVGAVAAGAAGLSLPASRLRASGPPNVLLIIVDQMRRPVWFPPGSKLPSLERLKSRGVEFTSHFVSAVPCSPSRACLMTGLHMDRNGVFNNMHREVQPSLDPRIPTLGRMFREAGYLTPYIGKWHLSLGRESLRAGLEPYGFDWLMAQKKSIFLPGLMQDGGYTRAACEWIEKSAGGARPWFMTVSLINPHDICSFPRADVPPLLVPDVTESLPDNWDDSLEGKPLCQRQYQQAYTAINGKMDPEDEKPWRHYLDYYYFLNRRTDAHLGRVLDALDRSGQAENTIVVFTSDHGDMGGSHRLRSKGPCVYRENTNVPLVVSWPGVIRAGAAAGALSQNVDLFPTLGRLAGVCDPSYLETLPGRDLGPVLADPEGGEAADHVLFSFTNNIMIAMACRMRGAPGVTAPQRIRAVRTRDYVYARYFDSGVSGEEHELYDLRDDPLEMVNLAGDPGRRGMESEMRDLLAEAETREMQAGPDLP